MRPWVKLPTDLGFPDLSGLSDPEELTYLRLFRLAGRNQTGALQDPKGRRSVRALAKAVKRPLGTFHAHLRELERRGLVAVDLLRRRTVPAIRHVNALFAPTRGEENDDDENSRPGGRDFNNGEVMLPEVFDGPNTSVRLAEPPYNPQEPTASSLAAGGESEKKTYVSSASQAVENGSFRPDVEHLIRSCARRDSRWARLLSEPREVGTVLRLQGIHPLALQAALRQAADDPSVIANPGAWLTKTVPAIAGGRGAVQT